MAAQAKVPVHWGACLESNKIQKADSRELYRDGSNQVWGFNKEKSKSLCNHRGYIIHYDSS